MEINPTFEAAINSVDLSTWQKRRGATALVIVLLDKIYFAEEDELDLLSTIPCRSESELDESTLNVLRGVISILYNAYELNPLRRLGIQNYLRKYRDTNYLIIE